jgi:dinuclear metal center YbgI/SA1388 family protein
MTVTVRDVCVVLEELAPLQLAESWDNVGLLLGHSAAPVRNIMTCLTLTEAVAAEAVRKDAQLIVTHHPILFRATKRLTDSTPEGRILLQLAAAGVAVYSAHTAFDSAAEGINQSLAAALGLIDVQPLRPALQDSITGAGRYGRRVTPVHRSAFLKQVATVTSATALDVCPAGPDQITVVGVACGSAAEFLPDAARLGCDTFVTGEARFHAVLEAQASGINLILTGHYASERPAVEALADRLHRKLPALCCFASEADADPLVRYSR